MGGISWNLYATATDEIPEGQPFSGEVDIIFPSDVDAAEAILYGGREHLRYGQADPGRAKLIIRATLRKADSIMCIPFTIRAIGDSILEAPASYAGYTSSLHEDTSAMRPDHTMRWRLGSGFQEIVGQACQWDGGSLFESTLHFDDFTFDRSSDVTVYRAPAIGLSRTNVDSKEWRNRQEYTGDAFSVDAIILPQSIFGPPNPLGNCFYYLGNLSSVTERVEVKRPESLTSAEQIASYEKVVIDKDALDWIGCGSAKIALIKDSKLEKESNRLLFVAGALIGVAVSLFFFSLEAIVGARHRGAG